MLRSERASARDDGVSRGCTTLSGCSTPIECDATGRKLSQQDRSHKPWHEANGGAQCGKSARCVATWRGLETWHGRDIVTLRRKSELTVNTNFDLNRRASPRPYLREAGGAIPSAYSPNLRKTAPQRRFMPKLPIRHPQVFARKFRTCLPWQ